MAEAAGTLSEPETVEHAQLYSKAKPLLAVTYAGLFTYSALFAAGLLMAPRQVQALNGIQPPVGCEE